MLMNFIDHTHRDYPATLFKLLADTQFEYKKLQLADGLLADTQFEYKKLYLADGLLADTQFEYKKLQLADGLLADTQFKCNKMQGWHGRKYANKVGMI